MSTADCIPIILYDAEHRATAAIHAGWRGTVKRIAQNTIAQMRTAFGTNPQSLRAIIGPGISLHNFEVGNEVYEAFANAAAAEAEALRRQMAEILIKNKLIEA